MNEKIKNMIKHEWEKEIYIKIPSFKNLIEKIISGDKVKLCCIRHNDLDGVGIEILLRLLTTKYQNLNVVFFEEKVKADESFEDIINNTLYQGYYILIADLSFTSKKVLDDIFKRAKNPATIIDKLFLLDHHESAVWMNNYDWCFVKPHNNKEYIVSSGTILVFKAFGYLFELKDDSCDNQFFSLIEKFANAVAAYDTYFWKEESEMSYSQYEDLPNDLNMIFKSSKPDNKHEIFSDYIVDNIINQKCIISGEDEMLLLFTKNNIDSVVKRALSDFQTINIDNHKVAIYYYTGAYISEIGAGICEKNDDIDYAMIVNMNLSQVSLRTQKDDINLAELIKHIPDSGGHPKAAGFRFCSIEFRGNNMNDFLRRIMEEK